MQPNEIGHAAAYEAYRIWMHNRSMYEPFGDDIERQREALTGLAVAEGSSIPMSYSYMLTMYLATRLLQYFSRPMDEYTRLAASEAAAHTASYIFYQVR